MQGLFLNRIINSRVDVMNGKISTLARIATAAGLLLSGAAASAQTLDLNVSNDSALFRYIVRDTDSTGFGNREVDLGLAYTTDDAIVGMFGAQVVAEAGSRSPGLDAGLGLKLFGANADLDEQDDMNLFALTLGGQLHFVPPPVPRLHLGQNTLPDPPFAMAAEVPFGDLTRGWRECHQSLVAFLQSGVMALRTQPIPDISTYSEQVRILQRVLRFDSIAMVWCDPGRAMFSLVALAVDRAGNALAGRLPSGGGLADIEVTDERSTADDLIVALLHEVLQAQYEWTTTAFGLVP